MSSNTGTTLNPEDEQVASSEPKLAQQETELVTHPKGDNNESVSDSKQPDTSTGLAKSAATSATTAATGMKDGIFSMFGGGAKKEKRVEPEDDVNEPSGSSKAKKDAEDAENAENPEVRTDKHHCFTGRHAKVWITI